MKIFFLKLLVLIILMTISSVDLIAQVNWTKYQYNPVLTGPSGSWYREILWPCVLYNPDSSRYEMWFTANSIVDRPFKIGFATSQDLITWSVYPNPVITPTPGEWDAYSVEIPSVVRENGQYKMWYSGCSTFPWFKIGYAESPDGINWTKHPNPVLEPGTEIWESGAVFEGYVMADENGYKMWYSGTSTAGAASPECIGYASSIDGINWERYINNPVLIPGESGEWDDFWVWWPCVMYINNSYYMWYNGSNTSYLYEVGLATSPDGLNWEKCPDNPVLKPTPGQWDKQWVVQGTVLLSADSLIMIYSGFSGPNDYLLQIGLASSPFSPIGVNNEPPVAKKYTLEQNYPNPFNPSTVISWQSPVGSRQSIKIFDILGNEIVTLVDEYRDAGKYKIEFNASELASGVYFYQLKAGDFIKTKKMLLTK